MEVVRLMSLDWQTIETAPLDGQKVWVKRVFEGRMIKEGWAVFGSLASYAPQRQWANGGLYPPIAPDHQSANQRRWSNPDRLYRFPQPTHWSPERTYAGL